MYMHSSRGRRHLNNILMMLTVLYDSHNPYPYHKAIASVRCLIFVTLDNWLIQYCLHPQTRTSACQPRARTAVPVMTACLWTATAVCVWTATKDLIVKQVNINTHVTNKELTYLKYF